MKDNIISNRYSLSFVLRGYDYVCMYLQCDYRPQNYRSRCRWRIFFGWFKRPVRRGNLLWLLRRFGNVVFGCKCSKHAYQSVFIYCRWTLVCILFFIFIPFITSYSNFRVAVFLCRQNQAACIWLCDNAPTFFIQQQRTKSWQKKNPAKTKYP